MIHRRQALAIGLGGLVSGLPLPAAGQQQTGFSAKPAVAPSLGLCRVVRDAFWFTDRAGRRWDVPAGYRSDGASIPPVLWTVTGGPWDPAHADAALVHDVFCQNMQRGWEATHRVFYEAMKAIGTAEVDALSKYWAVHKFGPRWDTRYRWTGALEWNKRERTGPVPPVCPSTIMRRPRWGMYETDTGDLPQVDSVAAYTDEQFLAYQQAEYERARAIIADASPSLEDVDALEPAETFDYNAAYEANYNAAMPAGIP